MAVDKLVDSTQLDADLTSVANAIRTKGGTSAQLAFPAEFVSAIGDIETGGGGSGYTLVKSGTYTTTSDASATLYIPVGDYSGTPKAILVCVDAPLDGIAQAIAQVNYYVAEPAEVYSAFAHSIMYQKLRSAANAYSYNCLSNSAASPHWDAGNERITCTRPNTLNLWRANTYHWYIYEEAST